MNKKVILSANTSWYLFNFRASTIHAFKALGYEVICIAPEDSYSQKLVTCLGCKWVPLTLDNKGSNPVRDLGFMWQLVKIFSKFKPVAVFNFTIKNNIYGTRGIVVKSLTSDWHDAMLSFFEENSINYGISENVENFPKCVVLNKIGDIYQKKAIKNFLINKSKKNYNIYLIDTNNCGL